MKTMNAPSIVARPRLAAERHPYPAVRRVPCSEWLAPNGDLMKSRTELDDLERQAPRQLPRLWPLAPPAPARDRGPLRRARARRSPVVALCLAIVLVACGEPLQPPTANAYQRLLGTAALWGVQVSVSYDPDEFEFTGFAGADAGVIARAYDDGDGLLTLGLVATAGEMSGEIVRLTWRGPEGAPAPHLTSSAAYDEARNAVPQALTLGQLVADQNIGPASMVRVLSAEELGAVLPAGDDLPVTAQALDGSFADYLLGDVDKSGAVTVLDALLTLDVVTGAASDPDDYTLYHSDLSGDDDATIDDVEMLVAKAIDPTVPAHLVVKPRRLTYLDLVADEPVLVGNGGSQALAGLSFDGRNFTGSDFAGAATQPHAGHSAVYTVSDPNAANGVLTVAARDQSATVDVGYIVFLVAGQSNAGGWGSPMIGSLQNGAAWPEVRALGNDYVWKPAVEALDNGLGQLDMISFDSANLVSAGVQLGRLLNGGDDEAGIAATDRYVYLIPAARGASRLTPRTSGPDTGSGWHIGPADLAATDRATLFGSAAYRGLVSSGQRTMPADAGPSEHDAEGGPVTAVYWYQGESDSSESSYRGNFAAYSANVFSGFEDHFETGAGVPVIIYAQLAPYGYDPNEDASTDAALGEDLRQMDIAERQRRMEEGAYTGTPYLSPQSGLGSPRANTHMVVTNDLPRSDRIHVSSAAQMILAERIALAYQEHYMGLDVDGTGPRVTGLTRSGAVVTVTFDRDVTQTSSPGANGYSRYFTAWNGTPSPANLSSSYGTSNEVAVEDVRRHPTNPRAVQVTLESSPTTIYLRYMRPHQDTLTSSFIQDVVRGAESGLPLPSFGPLRVN